MHSFTNILVHCVWSTKNREPVLSSDLRGRLWPYLGGIARENKMKAISIGAADHVHILVSLAATLSIARALQLLKGNSSKWIHETFPKMRSFEWQEGYGAFQHRSLWNQCHGHLCPQSSRASSHAIIS
jgi:putative transposase